MLSEEAEEMISASEQREAYRVQRELLNVIHGDGEARTRSGDKAPAVSLLNQATTLLVGVVIGALATFSALTGRIATAEATLVQHGEAIAELKRNAEEIGATNREILGILRAPSGVRGAPYNREK